MRRASDPFAILPVAAQRDGLRSRTPMMASMLFGALFALAVLPGACAPLAAQTAVERPDAGEAEDDIDQLPAKGSAKLALVPAPYPAAIQRSLDQGNGECRDAGGSDIVLLPGIVRTGDLTGRGRPAYVVDWRHSRCRGALGMFNGTGGWDLEIFVTTRSGKIVQIFQGRVLGYDISAGPGARTITFDLHGGYCGLVGADPCVKRRRIDGRRFAFRN